MDTKTLFIKDITIEFIASEWPTETEFLDVILEEMEKTDFSFEGKSFRETPLGLGADDIIEALKSPVVVATLAALWTSLVSPVIKDVIKERILTRIDSPPVVSAEVLKKLTKLRIKDYILSQAEKAGLTDESASLLADRVLSWLNRHSDELVHLKD